MYGELEDNLEQFEDDFEKDKFFEL